MEKALRFSTTLLLLLILATSLATGVEWSVVQPANQGTSDVESANADKLDGYQPAGLTWTILGIAKNDVSKSNVGLGNVMNINQSNLAGNGLNWDSANKQLDAESECPSGYVKVPGSNKHGTEDFCVMKFEAKDDGSGNPVSQASSNPWVNIDQYDARKECRSLGEDYHLITEAEWMTIADNTMRQPENWADGNIGSKASDGGGMYIGNVNPPSSHSHLGYDGSDPESGTGRDTTARLQLSNGNYIWDFSGNVWEWTNGYMTTEGVPEPDNNGWTEYTDITKFQEMSGEKPMNPAWNASNGVGRIYLDQSPYSNNDKITNNIHAVRRGGYWDSGARAGALSVTLHTAPSGTYSSIGFRCSYSVS